jgi:hypothetical protein
LSGGHTLVVVEGTNFREPPTPAADGPTTAPEPSVEVKFGSVEALDVGVISTTQLMVLIPPTEPGDHDVTITNLDNDGVAIPGETVTAATAFTTARPDLTDATTVRRVIEGLILETRAQLLENVMTVAHTEYDDTTGDAFSIIATSSLPALAYIGPRTEENRFYSENELVVGTVADAMSLYGKQRPARTIDIGFTVVCATDHYGELVNLVALFIDFVQRNTHLKLLRDPDDASLGYYEYEFDLVSTPEVAANPNVSNVRSWTGEVVIRGVDVEPGDMVTSKLAKLVDRTPTVGDPEPWIELDMEPYE